MIINANKANIDIMIMAPNIKMNITVFTPPFYASCVKKLVKI